MAIEIMLVRSDVLINTFKRPDFLSTSAGFNTTELLSGETLWLTVTRVCNLIRKRAGPLTASGRHTANAMPTARAPRLPIPVLTRKGR